VPAPRYLTEIIDYGGIPTARAEAICDMQSLGIEPQYIDRWLQGYEFAQRLAARKITTP
jgi:hypothetical protein